MPEKRPRNRARCGFELTKFRGVQFIEAVRQPSFEKPRPNERQNRKSDGGAEGVTERQPGADALQRSWYPMPRMVLNMGLPAAVPTFALSRLM